MQVLEGALRKAYKVVLRRSVSQHLLNTYCTPGPEAARECRMEAAGSCSGGVLGKSWQLQVDLRPHGVTWASPEFAG